MNCLVTAGPTYEPLDAVRRLTNFSTGRLGVELANYLTDQGHVVTLLLGEAATHAGERRVASVGRFTTTTNLRERLQALGGDTIQAVFHAAAVSDFAFGTVWQRAPGGALTAVQAGKFASRAGGLLVELTPTPKLISHLRGWFPRARLAGWKYEVDGNRADVLQAARRQLAEARTDLCVANGPAHGPGFGLVTPETERPVADAAELYTALEQFINH
jgi:phosphopantothenate---cysteine ligase (CTP)